MRRPAVSDIPIPEAALGSHIAILGKTGSGKTYAAKAIAERLIAQGRRVCVVDPTGAWWGLKRDADGEGPADFDGAGGPVVVLGGRHGDVALAEGVGKAIGKVVGGGAGGGLPVCVIDTGDLTVGARTRLFADFAEELYRTNRGPLWLFIDECHLFAPQGRVLDPQAGRMLHAASALISGGRSRGIRVVLISQRPQKVHKDALTQVETLVMMRLIAPQDRKAVEEWVKENDDAGRGKEVLDTLAKLKVGESWVWAPAVDDDAWMDATGGAGLVRARWPRIGTYDSSSTPDDESEIPEFDEGGVDIEALRSLLGEAAEAITRDDPKALRQQIEALKRQIREGGFDQSALDGATEQCRMLERECERLNEDCERHLQMMVEAAKWYRSCPEWLKTDPDKFTPSPSPLPKGGEAESTPARHEFKFSRGEAVRPHPASRKIASASGVSGPQMKILGALAWFESVGVGEVDRSHIAAIAGVSPRSSGFEKNISTLRTGGYIDYPGPGLLQLTPLGRGSAPPVDSPVTINALHEAWLNSPALSGPQRLMLAMLLRRRSGFTREELAERLGVSVRSSGFEKNISRLSSLGVAEYPAAGSVRASALLYPEGLR